MSARSAGLRKPQSRTRGSRPKDLRAVHPQGGYKRGEARADGMFQIKAEDYKRGGDDRGLDGGVSWLALNKVPGYQLSTLLFLTKIKYRVELRYWYAVLPIVTSESCDGRRKLGN